jgi:glycosyltransferase involved in cell wall biosynthesis
MGIRAGDFASEECSPSGPFTVGYLARICREKGLAEFCRAFRLLKKMRPRSRLRIAGYLGPSDRVFWDETQAYLRQHGLVDTVEFVGEVSRRQKRDFLRTLHVLSVPTVYPESKGFYVLEALACGVPVVVPEHGSFPELIEETGGGRLHRPNDAQAVADTIAELMDNEVLRRQLANHGRAAVCESFTDEIMADQTWEVYQRYVR